MGYNIFDTRKTAQGQPPLPANGPMRFLPLEVLFDMKLHHRALSLVLAAGMAFTLTACDPMESLKGLVVDMVHAMGLGTTTTDDGSDELHPPVGGSITFPEGFDPTGSFHYQLQDGQLYIAFNDISLNGFGNTDYFTAAGDSVTITAYGSTDESLTSIDSYKIALWELSDDNTHTTYVPGSTLYIDVSTDETCHTQTITGLTPGKRYKATVTFDSTRAYATGAICISGLTDDALVSTDSGNGEGA